MTEGFPEERPPWMRKLKAPPGRVAVGKGGTTLHADGPVGSGPLWK